MKDRPVFVASLPARTIHRTFILSLGEWTWPYVNEKGTKEETWKNEREEGGECKKLEKLKLCERRMGLRRGERLAALVRHCLSASLTSLIPSVNLSERFDFAFFVLPASGGALVVNRKLMNHPGRRNLSMIGWVPGDWEVKIRLVPLYFRFLGIAWSLVSIGWN